MASWTPKGTDVFVSSDGDNIGSHVAAAILSGKVSEAHRLSLLINIGGKATQSYAKKVWGAKTIIMGGDDLMIQAKASSFDPSKVEGMRADYKSKVGATLSCGIGSTPQEAMMAIVIAKNTGKNKAVFWEDSMKATYKQVVKKRINQLRTKLTAAGGPSLKESEIPADIKKHVKRELHKALRQRSKQNRENQSIIHVHKAPVKTGPTPQEKARQDRMAKAKEQKAKAAKKHGPEMVSTMRDFLVHQTMHQNQLHKKARVLDAMGHHNEARAFRVAAKLAHHKMMKDHKILHTAAQIKDPELLHPATRKKLVAVRSSMASRMKAARAGHRQADVLATILRNHIAGRRKQGRHKAKMAAISARSSSYGPGGSFTGKLRRKSLSKTKPKIKGQN